MDATHLVSQPRVYYDSNFAESNPERPSRRAVGARLASLAALLVIFLLFPGTGPAVSYRALVSLPGASKPGLASRDVAKPLLWRGKKLVDGGTRIKEKATQLDQPPFLTASHRLHETRLRETRMQVPSRKQDISSPSTEITEKSGASGLKMFGVALFAFLGLVGSTAFWRAPRKEHFPLAVLSVSGEVTSTSPPYDRSCPSEMSKVDVVVLGCGGVGRALLTQIAALKASPLRVTAVCDSKTALVKTGAGFSAEELRGLADLKKAGKPLASAETADVEKVELAVAGALLSVIQKCSTAAAGKCIVADNSASEEIGATIAEVMTSGPGCGAVFCNKKPTTGSMEVYKKLSSKPALFRGESTVGAGLPILAMLTRMVRSGDVPHKVAGCFSGTLGFVMSGLEAGKKFSEVVTEAKNLGYTEPDPRDDLSGMDVARKALIMARLLGYELNMDSFPIESLYPDHLAPGKVSVEEFMARLPELDDEMSAKVQAAVADGKVLRYVALVTEGKVNVGPSAVPKTSAMGALQGTDNIAEISSACYSSTPLVIQGAGAGTETTASGVLADILEIADIMA